MPAKGERAGSLLSSGTFWAGMAFLIAAPLMNLAYDRMVSKRLGGDGSEILPSFLANLYDQGGKTGVTLTLLAIGVVILLFGFLRQNIRGHWGSSTAESANTANATGQLVLQTRKYLPQASLSGTTGFPLPRQPQS
jgi:hypothetical protein